MDEFDAPQLGIGSWISWETGTANGLYFQSTFTAKPPGLSGPRGEFTSALIFLGVALDRVHALAREQQPAHG